MPDYSIDYNDERFAKVETDKNEAIAENDKMYDGMIEGSDKFYNDQIQVSKDWVKEQTKIQNEQTDFAIDQINQQKEYAKKDYIKEQSGAYADWQKQSDQYGANSEQMAAQGMTQTGFAESTQTSMYNTYQARVATAREAFSRAIVNYDNAIKDARMQNNAKLAEIAYQGLQDQTRLALEGFQYKNSLITEKADKRIAIDEMYHNRWMDVLGQMNTDNAMKENARQHDENLAEKKRQHDENIAENKRQFDQSFAEEQRQFNEQMSSKKSSGGDKIKQPKEKNGGDDDDKIKQPKEKSGGDDPVTMRSIINMGYGPISADNLNEKVKSGEVVEHNINGKTVFTKNPNKKPTDNLFFSKNRF